MRSEILISLYLATARVPRRSDFLDILLQFRTVPVLKNVFGPGPSRILFSRNFPIMEPLGLGSRTPALQKNQVI